MTCRSLIPLFYLGLVALPLAAQDIYGAITGTVTDPTGAVVPGATVRAVHSGTKATFQTASSAEGTYVLRGLPVGVYELSAEAPGFKKFEAKSLRLQVNDVLRVDVRLEVGTALETVTVSEAAVTVDSTTATLRAVIDRQRIEELPLNGRNPLQLMRLVAGVQLANQGPGSDVTSGTTYPGVTPVSVNGGRANTTNYLLDGAQHNDHYSNAPNPMPNPDALQEFSVIVNNFSAEFGRQAGGVVNAVTRSGTNEFHGSAFEYVRNSALNAANFFAPAIRPGKKQDDGLRRNQFGVTAGGPVLLPSLYDGRNRTFFFFAYQGTRLRRTPTVVNVITPTVEQRRGDFSALRRQLRDPFGGGFYPNNLIPRSHLDPIAATILENYVPAPPPGSDRIAVSAPSPFDENQYLIRGDQNFSDRNRLTVRLWHSGARQPGYLNPRNYLSQAVVWNRVWRNRSAALTDTHIVSPRVTNTFLLSYSETDGDSRPILPEKSLASLGVNIYNDDKPQYHLTVSGYFSLNTGDTNVFPRRELQLQDTVRASLGSHQLSLGGELGRGKQDIRNNFRANGQFTWSGAAPFTTDSLADYMVGKFQQLVQGAGEYKDNRYPIYALFIQDSWRARRRLNLELGLRWEPFVPYWDKKDRLAVWRPGRQSTRFRYAPAGVLFAGDPGIPRGGFETAWKNIGPRLGLAWDVFGDGRTSLRAGYGIFFDRMNIIMTNSQANQAPFATTVVVYGNMQNSFRDPYAGTVNPFPAPLDPPGDFRFILPHTAFLYEEHMANPYLQAWNLTVEREFRGGVLGRIAYAGSKGTRLTIGREMNPAIYRPGATTADTNQRRPLYPLLAGVTLVEPVGNSTFHSLQLTAERRLRAGFSVLANYMWSKSIDDATANKITGQNRSNPFSQRFDKGPSDFDHTHVVTVSGLWAIPGSYQHRLARWLLGGWKTNFILSLQTGAPYTVYSGVDNARSGTPTTGAAGQRADLVGNPYLPEGRSRGEKILRWLNPDAFAPNALGTFGNQGRNMWRMPGLANVDAGLHKDFPLAEQIRLTFRFEAFNVFNRVNLGAPDSNRSSGNFNRISSAFDPRILQLALRLAW
jgi:hypothetical protein